MSEQTVTLQTADGPMDAFLAKPDRPGRLPALVVIQEAFGVNSHMKNVCRRLAGEGYLAMAPELFHRDGPGIDLGYDDIPKVMPYIARMSNASILMDVEAAMKEVRGRADVDAERVGMIGFCMGGFATLLAACRLNVKTAVSFYGGGVVRTRPGIALTPFADELPGVKAPVLAVFGARDQSITEEDIQAIRRGLDASGARHEILVCPEGGHGFACDERASYDAESAAMAWAKTEGWLKANL